MGPQFFVDGGFVCTYKGITRLLGRGSVRITPARAGKRKKYKVKFAGFRDHPRACGEKDWYAQILDYQEGSPPRVRGKAGVGGYTLVTGGITHAHAGKRNSGNSIPRHGRDHPRTRGEKPSSRQYARADLGSPPHTRGKEVGDFFTLLYPGITPAHAGKSAGLMTGSGWFEDHARTRGEKEEERRTNARHWGSPPHTRGKVFRPFAPWLLAGITPAHAGKRLNGSRF